MSEIELLRQEVAVLRQQIDEVDDWANGIQHALIAVLPFLLRGHPEVSKVEGLLRSRSERYAELLAHPERAEGDETALLHEAPKMLYWQLAVLGVWPGISSEEATRQLMAQPQRAVPGHQPD